jgi:2-oxoisovalerate dehydrogenase E2 component (dihydrolipoyl transacylase)
MQMADVRMPQLGESVTEGTIGKWLKQVGDKVTKYEPLLEVMTDKVNAEIPSDLEGVITEILVPEGETVAVGTVICRIDTGDKEGSDGEEEAGNGDEPPQASAGASGRDAGQSERAQDGGRIGSHATDARQATTAAQTWSAPIGGGAAATGGSSAEARTTAAGRYSPAVLRLAQENGVDLSQVRGTGEHGRITRKDVLAYIEARHQQRADASVDGREGTAEPHQAVPRVDALGTAEPSAVSAVDVGASAAPNGAMAAPSADDVQVIDPSPIRRTIARRMLESKHTIPHAWTMVEADVTKLVAFRQAVKTDFKRREGVDLTYLPFFVKAVAEALKQYPQLNAAWVDDRIHLKRGIHIGIAVATDDALVVPVIRDADRLSIAGLAHAIHDLATRARSGRLTVEDVQGGTFTVNNTGAFGSILSQPIINPPQAAILSVEAIVKRPVVVDDAIAIRSMVNLCLSLDHRVLDGWVCGQFLQAVKARLHSFDQNTILY